MFKKEVLRHLALWFGAGLALVGIFFLMYFFVWQGQNNPGQFFQILINEKDQKKGSQNSPIVLVEYSDYQCPACAAYHPLVEELLKTYSDKILFVYRHFPLRQHQYAQLAAQTAEAAGKQGKFWEMHAKLFENQGIWSESSKAKETFLDYAKELNLDTEKFLADLDSEAVKDKILSDYQSGVSFGVNGTPSFYLNGRKINNPSGLEAFKSSIEAEIQ